jgi:hypothetical protein
VRHVAEANTGNTELAEVTTRAPVDGVAAAEANRRCVTGELLEADAGGLAGLVRSCGIDECLLQFEALDGITRDDNAALLVLGNLAFLGHVLALLAEFDVLAYDGVVLLEHETVRVITAVLAGHVCVPGSCGGAKLDDRTYVLVLGH